LRDVPADEVRELLEVARRRRFARNETVFHRDDPGDSLHLIVSGRFAIRLITSTGDVVTLAIVGPGDSFGEMALIGEQPRRTATVTALEEAETFAVYGAEFAQVRHRYPGVDAAIMRFLVNQVRSLQDRLAEALHVPVERRILRRLVELAHLYGADDRPTVIPLTQETIAELAGASRATVNQVLREEERRGTIALQRGRTVVVDLATLIRRAHTGPGLT
jgi:CRP/FNR family cyclic AMP-dependent transcriptional regulator